MITAKFLYHLPLNRQEEMWESQEVPLSRKTAAGWLAGVAGLCDPLYRELKAHVFASKVVDFL